MNALVELVGISKRFRKRGVESGRARGHLAVDNVSFSIPAGATFGLVGESGCGKTTLARSLLYLDPPTSGSMVFDGTDLATLSRGELREYRRRMQIVFQDPNGAMNPKLSVERSLSEGLRNFGVGGERLGARIREVTDAVGIPETHLSRLPGEFSGGQKQRLVIARALTLSPEFLVLDEPVSNLDVSVQAQIINLLMDLKQDLGLTYLFISHDLNLVGYLADFIAVMYAGRVVEIGRIEEILNTPLHLYTRRLFAASARVVRSGNPPIGEEDATSTADEPRPDLGCAYRAWCSMSSSRCVTEKPEFRWTGPMRGVACFDAVPGNKAVSGTDGGPV